MNRAKPTVDINDIPEEFNAASYFIDRHMEEGRGDKIALIDDSGSYSYSNLLERTNRAANALVNLGLRQEARIAIAVLDCIEFPSVFWGAIKAGFVPVCLNTMLTTEHYRYILHKSRVQVLVVSEILLPNFLSLLGELHSIETVVVIGENVRNHLSLEDIMASASTEFAAVATSRDDTAFWLNSSGSTGAPKGVRHRHSSPY